MDNPAKKPLLFANRVIAMLVDHLVGSDYIVLPQDYSLMRVMFHANGGAWQSIMRGDMKHLLLLENIVKAWGQAEGRVKRTDLG